MKELVGNLWDYYDAGGDVCVTVNGFVKRNGEAVMGKGTALQACHRFPQLARVLGRCIQEKGTGGIYQLVPRVWSFPVKPAEGLVNLLGTNLISRFQGRFPTGALVPGWMIKADLAIIKQSLARLNAIRQGGPRSWPIILPRPGCGAGELDWETQVRPLCELYGDWLSVIDRWGRREG